MTKRFLACLLALIMVFSMIPMQVFADDTTSLVISECDALDGWAKEGGGNALSVNANNAYNSAAGLRCDVNYGKFGASYTPDSALDISGYTNIEWDMRFYTGTNNGLTGTLWEQIVATYGTSGNNKLFLKLVSAEGYRVYFLSKLETAVSSTNSEWVHFSATISDYNTESGTFDPTALTSFFFNTVDSNYDSTVSNGVIAIDNLIATGTDTTEPGDDTTDDDTTDDDTTEDLLLSDCDTAEDGVTGFVHTGGNAFKIGDDTLGWGSLSDNFTYRHVNYGAFRQSYFKLTEAKDISSYKSLKWNMYFGPVGLWESIQESYGSTIYVKLFNTDDDTGARMLFALDKIISTPIDGKPGWYSFAVNFDDCTNNINFDKTNFTRFSFVTIEGSALNTEIGEGVIGFDDIYLSKKAVTAAPITGEGWPIVTTTVDKTVTGNNFVYENNSFNYDLSAYGKDGLWIVAKVYVENQTNPDDLSNFIADGQLELTSSGGSDVQEASWTVDKLGLRSGWTSLRLKISEANNDNGLDLSNINYLRLYIKPGNTDTYRIKLQDVYITNVAENSPLPSVFSDGMMFQQNKTMNLWGQVGSDSNVTVELYKAGTLIETATTKSDIDGNWEVKLPARKGSYDVYSITVKVDGEIEKEIADVMIGELWISAGQSNMEFFLGQTIPGYDWSLIPLDKYVRVFVEPTVPGGVTGTLPVKPAYDIEGAYWTNGSMAANVKYVSAIAYYSCLQLREELDVPVGFINAAKGASVIEAWLSRESIDNNEKVKQTLTDKRVYKTEQTLNVPGNWNLMTALYNTKLAPLAGFNIAGVMWYQGESNVKYAETNGENLFYEEALRQLAEDWAGLFGFEKGEMPFLYAHLAPYNYSTVRTSDYDTILPKLSESMSKVWASYPNSMVQIPIYDVSLTYKNPPDRDFDPIHPSSKKPVAERFANAMLSRFYSVGTAGYNAAVYKSMRVVGNKIYITMDQVGTGLSIRNNNVDLDGFTICSSDRVFVNAYAKIVSNDTIEVYSPMVSNPVAAAYAFSSFNMNANLVNSYGLPVVPFRTDNVDSTFIGDNDWMNADYETVWVDTRGGNTADFNATWEIQKSGAAISFDKNVKSQGNSSLKLTTTVANVGAGPILKQATMVYRLGTYKYLSVMVKNPDSVDKTLKLKVGNNYATALDGTISVTVPKNSDFTFYVFNMGTLKTASGGAVSNPANSFNAYLDFDFVVAETGTVYLDDIRLGTEAPSETEIVETALGTTVASFLSANGLASGTVVYNGTTALASNALVGTNCYASNGSKTVYAFVRYDVDGDGKCNATDLILARNHLLDNKKLDGLYLDAAKRNSENANIDAVDLVRMKKQAAK